MGLILKTKITEQQMQDAIIASETAEKFSDIDERLDEEKAARELADVQLQNALLTEKNLREAADELVQRNLDNESSARISGDSKLQQNLSSEAMARLNGDTILQNSLDTERNSRITAEADLQDKIDAEISERLAADTSLKNKIEAETSNRKTALTDMQAAIMVSLGDNQALQNIENENLKKQIQEQSESQSANVFNLQNNLNTEIQNRQNADTAIRADLNSGVQTLTANLNTEILNRKSEDAAIRADLNSNVQSLSNDLDTEIKNRQTAIQDMQAAIMVSLGDSQALQNIENENLKNQISSQTALQAASIKDLKNDLDTEIKNRQTAIQDMQAAILVSMGNNQALQDIENENLKNQISSQTALQAASIKDLKNDLDEEAKTRAAADTSLATTIQNEVTARTNAITNLQSSLTSTINSKAISTLDDAKTYADTKFNGVANSLNDFTAPTATANGVHGLVPAPPKGTGLLVLTTKGWMALSDTNVTIANAPNQSGTLTYNRSSQSPTWANFDTSKMTISGTTSGTSAGTYTATFTPSGLYVWADTKDQSAKNVNWTIQALKLTKPSASTTSFSYDGDNKSLSVSNYNSTYMTESGTKTASAVGSYSVKYTLKNTTNTKWADNTTAAVTINWSIAESKLTAAQSSGFAQTGSLTYNGNSQSVTIANYDSTVHVLGSTTSATNAGNYTATISPKTGLKWSDGTTAAKNVSWSIAALKLTKPSASTTSFVYNGSNKSLTISNYNSTYMNESGTKTASAVGSYSVKYTLKNTTNTKWADNSTAAVTINWSIEESKLTAAQSSGFAQTGSLTYNGNSQSVTISNYDSSVHVLGSTTSATNAGNYTATISPKSGLKWSDGTTTAKNVSWSIAALKLTKPSASTTSFVYNGSDKSLSVSNYNATYMNESGTKKASAVGNYSVEYTLKNTTNTTWADGSTSKVTISWSVTSNALTKPTLTSSSKTYNASAQSPTLKNFNADYMTKTGNESATNAGNYSITIALKDKNTYTWADGTTADLVLSWSIAALKLTKPSASTTSFTYNGESQSLTISNYNSTYMTESGTKTASTAGSYSIKYTLKNTTNTKWADNSTAAVTVNWSIAKLQVVEPSLLATSYEYTGAAIEATLKDYDSDLVRYTVSGDLSATNAASYSITFTLRDKTNTIWKTAQNTNNLTLNWAITLKKIPAAYSTFAFTGDFTYTRSSAMDRAFVATTFYLAGNISGFSSSYHVLGGTTSETHASTYTATITPKDGYCWSDGTTDAKNLEWTIKPRYVDRPNLVKTFVYDGTFHGYGYDWTETKYPDYFAYGYIADFWKDDKWVHSGGVDVGTYEAHCSIKSHKGSVLWSDTKDNDDHIFFIEITPATLTSPTLKNSSLNYSGNSQSVTIQNFDSNTMTVDSSSVISATEIGEYKVKIVASDNNYRFAGGASEIYLDWKIVKCPLAVPQVTLAEPTWGQIKSNSDEPYNDEFYTPSSYVTSLLTVEGYDSNLMSCTFPDKPDSKLRSGDYTYYSYVDNNPGYAKIRFELKDTEHYTWENSSSAVKVIYKDLPKFVISSIVSNMQPITLTYDGALHDWCDFFYINGHKFYHPCYLFKETLKYGGWFKNYVGYLDARDVGSYEITLTPINRITWNDGTTDTKTFTLTIKEAD